MLIKIYFSLTGQLISGGRIIGCNFWFTGTWGYNQEGSLRSSRFRARGHWAKRSKKVGEGGGAGKEKKRLPLSPDILPNAPKWLRFLGAYTVKSNVT